MNVRYLQRLTAVAALRSGHDGRVAACTSAAPAQPLPTAAG